MKCDFIISYNVFDSILQTHEQSSSSFDIEIGVYDLSLLSSDWFAGEVDHEHEAGFLPLARPDGVHVGGTLVEGLSLLLLHLALVHQRFQVDYRHFLVELHRLRVYQLVLIHIPASPFQVQSVYVGPFFRRLTTRLVCRQKEELPSELVNTYVQLSRRLLLKRSCKTSRE